MRRKGKTGYYFMLLSCFAVTLCFASTDTTTTPDAKKQSNAKDRKVVARVNGNPIYEDQLASGVKKELKRFKKYGKESDSPDLVKRLQEKTVHKVIDTELIYQEGQKLTIKNLDEKIEQKLKKMKRRHQTAEQFEKYLKARNLSLKELRKSLKKRVYIDEYLKKQGISDPEIPEEDIKRFYDSNPKAYAREESIKVSHILIKIDENTDPEKKGKAFKKAEQIRKEILGGKDFAEMAKKHSECNSASGGGSLRTIKKGYMPAEFDQAAFALKEGKVSEVVETKFGFHIIKVFKKTPGGIAPYPEVRDFIRKFLQEDESKKKLAEHLAKLKEKAKIEIFLSETKKE